MLIAVLTLAVVAAGVAPAQGANQSIELHHDAYVPARVALQPGEKVFWTNPDDHEEHNVHFETLPFVAPVPPTIGPWTIERQFNDPAGAYRFYCEIHGAPGGIGMSGIAYVNATGTLPPSAKLTAQSFAIGAGGTANFSATTSTAAAGRQIVTYEWDLDGNGTFETSGTAPTASRGYAGPGIVNVKLRVTDDVGQTDTIAQDLRVTAVPTASFSASPGAAKTGQAVTFDASTSSDSDGAIIRYEWDLDGNGSFETNTEMTPRATRAYTTAGTRTIRLRVTDDLGVSSTTTRQVVVSAATAAPPPAAPAAPQPVACSSLSGTTRATCMQRACASVSRSRRSACYQKSCRYLPKSKRASCVRKSCRWASRSKRSACMKKSCRYLKGSKRRACTRKYSRRR